MSADVQGFLKALHDMSPYDLGKVAYEGYNLQVAIEFKNQRGMELMCKPPSWKQLHDNPKQHQQAIASWTVAGQAFKQEVLRLAQLHGVHLLPNPALPEGTVREVLGVTREVLELSTRKPRSRKAIREDMSRWAKTMESAAAHDDVPALREAEEALSHYRTELQYVRAVLSAKWDVIIASKRKAIGDAQAMGNPVAALERELEILLKAQSAEEDPDSFDPIDI